MPLGWLQCMGGMLTPTCVCSKLQHNNFETIEGVLQFYPRLHRDCQLEMQDGEYATLVGTVIKNKTVHRVSMSIMLLEFTVKPGVLASLRGQPHSLGIAPMPSARKRLYFLI